MVELINFIQQYQELDAQTKVAILDCFFEEEIGKNEFILEKGKTCTKISFIKSGLVRRYYTNEEKESTIWLYHDKHWISCASKLFSAKTCFREFTSLRRNHTLLLNLRKRTGVIKLPTIQRFSSEFPAGILSGFR